jgi:ABC-type multidrug transport system fused ATPase/permease subunit
VGVAELIQQGCFVLDEPSSALDPDREFELFTRLKRERLGRITIFVTHRYFENMPDVRSNFGSKQGCLVQVGTHDELMKDEDGMYARLYKLQDQIIHQNFCRLGRH